MLVIGLTGGIGAGKSTVSNYLKQLNYKIIDADKISHEITQIGSPTIKKIGQSFGSEVILPDGSLNRKEMAKVVFSDKSKKALLESIITEKVIEIIRLQLNDLRDTGFYGIIFVDAPLLFETGADALTDVIWLVDADMDVRINRVMERDHVAYDQVMERINNQMSSEEKKFKSDEIIDNSNGKDVLYDQVKKLLLKYDRKTKR